MRGFGSTRAALMMVTLGTCVVTAQGQPPAGQPAQPQGRGNQAPPPPMTFFVTSTPIGKGPWNNVKGGQVARDLEQLHGDTLELARLGNTLTRVTALTEKGEQVPGVAFPGGPQVPNEHDILTGSQPDGRAYTDTADHTCNNWTSEDAGSAQLGHHDRTGGPGTSWNSVHPSKGCSQQALVSTGGAGRLYCFATGEAR